MASSAPPSARFGMSERFASETYPTPGPGEHIGPAKFVRREPTQPGMTRGKSFGLRHHLFANEVSQYPGPGAYSDDNPVHKPVGYYLRNRCVAHAPPSASACRHPRFASNGCLSRVFPAHAAALGTHPSRVWSSPTRAQGRSEFSGFFFAGAEERFGGKNVGANFLASEETPGPGHYTASPPKSASSSFFNGVTLGYRRVAPPPPTHAIPGESIMYQCDRDDRQQPTTRRASDTHRCSRGAVRAQALASILCPRWRRALRACTRRLGEGRTREDPQQRRRTATAAMCGPSRAPTRMSARTRSGARRAFRRSGRAGRAWATTTWRTARRSL